MTFTHTATDFLRAIFGKKPASHNVLVWTLNRATQEKVSNFFTDIEKAAEYAASIQKPATDIYFCIGTLPKLKKGRGKLEDVLGIGSVHLDVDVQNSAAHKKQNLPATIDEAISFVNQFDIKPSVLVHSGYGLHAYWLLQDFIAFTDNAVRDRAAGLIENWQKMYKHRAGQQGYDVDATQDITRVLRIPNTKNWKIAEAPVTARIIFIDESLRYTPDQLETYLAKVQSENKIVTTSNNAKPAVKAATSLKPFNKIQIELDEKADVSADLLTSLIDNVPKFKLTWERKRKDLQDTSASSYDMALANMAVGVGLNDQTVTNLLIAHRRKFNDEKPRLDYYQRTLAEAKDAMQQYRVVSDALKTPADHNDKDRMRKDIHTILGIRIERIEKMAIHPPEFTIFFSGGIPVNVGNSKGLFKQDDFRRFVGDAINKAPRKQTSNAWERIVEKLFALVEVVQPDEDLTPEGQFKEQILNFLYQRGFIKNEDEYIKDLTSGISGNGSGIIGNSLHIQLEALWLYIRTHYNKQTERKHIVVNLKRVGANRITKSIRKGNKKVTSYSLYALPSELTQAAFEQIEGSHSGEIDYAGKTDSLSTAPDDWQM